MKKTGEKSQKCPKTCKKKSKMSKNIVKTVKNVEKR